ncbi:type I pantothenate kinase [Terrihabitans rhizophilus]|jgi:type I pantothenate kinase|uniref:Pantothenate kinase n=1 Tax=Terrihabitans rhizophilus TaxID=3092662 RepID=A0ABU4RRN2_9HYPH|nr:type I pantothenate kinase [Terrihabitans sp. PJ23]MDX6807515.1 type I pantothenate kinase [Terrihabitans sp. PJ23]
MDMRSPGAKSPYRIFSRGEWAKLRADTPMTLSEAEVEQLRSVDDPVDLREVEQIYLPISRLLALYVEATQGLYNATRAFLNTNGAKVPYIIGIGGSVAVGKSTTARLLQALLARWPNTPKVDLVTTDGFLLPNAVLEEEGLMQRKGFPESYDLPALLGFMSDIKAGKRRVSAPVYSHLTYDVVPGGEVVVDRPDILILEGLNVLQAGTARSGKAMPFVSDFFDFSVYIDAEEALIHDWYVHRFLHLRETAFRDPQSYFQRYAALPASDALQLAEGLWDRINLPNLRDNILPTRGRASLVLRKAADHRVEEVALRKL